MGGESPILFSALENYARVHGIAGQDFEDFIDLMRALDEVWLEHRAEQDKRARERREKEKR